jgi:asparagine synthase (glutamine-hydrolysing)
MCGITGALSLHPDNGWSRERLGATIASMTAAIAHRGPDDDGTWVDDAGALALGHRRLAIVDLSPRGHQPMDYGARAVIAYNGEIYNFRELRTELLAAGHAFASGTDTEVIMAATLEWGVERALQRMCGMFAFAMWDVRRRVLYLARDRLGEKPLYLAAREGMLFFGSELQSMQAVPGLCTRLSDQAVALYLRHGYVPCPLSMFEGVFKLPQATYFEIPLNIGGHVAADIERGGLSVGHLVARRYWRVDSGAKYDYPPDEAVDRLEILLRDAVQKQMQCDVSMGVFLSGGIDSTAVAAITQALSPNPVSSFTVRFDAPGFDESAHAAAVARHLGTDHHEISIDPAELIAAIPAKAASLDEPTANASYFPLHLMSLAARRHVKVVLSGDAGDELFGGYNRYKLTPPLWRRVAWIPPSARRLLARGAGALPLGMLNGLRGGMAGLSGQTSPAASIKKLSRFLDAPTLGQSYQRLLRCWDDSSAVANVVEPREAALSCDPSTFLSKATAFDLEHYLPDDNLEKSDRSTMAGGLELRVPLLDHRIVEFARTLPDSLLIRDGVSKWLLRQVAYRHVPRELLDRPKMGFTVPIEAWLKGPLRAWATDLLHSDSLLDRALLKRNIVRREWDRFLGKQAPTAWEMWSLVMYIAWLSGRTASEPGVVLKRSA